MKNEIKNSELVLRVQVVSYMLVGYGDVFTCNVTDLIKGVLPDKQIRIVVLPGNKEQYDLSESELQGSFEIGFVKKSIDEPYSIMPINGFVDTDRNSWVITFTRKVISR
ncbi:MAG: hypothetical protein WBG90_02080 [Saonia sp.]